MISQSEHPIAWSAFMYELEDAREHLDALIRSLSEVADYGEPELRVELGHVFAHLNRAWNSRNVAAELSEGDRAAMRQFPKDLEPIA